MHLRIFLHICLHDLERISANGTMNSELEFVSLKRMTSWLILSYQRIKIQMRYLSAVKCVMA